LVDTVVIYYNRAAPRNSIQEQLDTLTRGLEIVMNMVYENELAFTIGEKKMVIIEKENGITRHSLETFNYYQEMIGTIQSVTIRETDECEWEVRVEAKQNDLILYGFSFGYIGEGTRGFLELLKRTEMIWTEDQENQILGQMPIHGKREFVFCQNDAQATLTTRVDEGFRRTAIQLTDHPTSVDVLARNGELLCRINISSSNDNADWANVDVCYGLANRHGKALAWEEGREVLRFNADGSSLIAVELTKGTE